MRRAAVVLLSLAFAAPAGAEMPRVTLDASCRGFAAGGERFTPWGFNYDHDRDGRLIEDYWADEWETVERDFAEMKSLGANVVRVHLQFGKFHPDPGRTDADQLARLGRLLDVAERTGLYLDLTGLGCYHKADVPAWYDRLSEADRWAAQAEFWSAVAAACRRSPAVFCYDLMNEPVVAGGRQADWLGPAFAGKHFVQFVARDPVGRERTAIARAWVAAMTAAVRAHDPDRLVTVGLIPDRGGRFAGFVPGPDLAPLDCYAIHVYPEAGKLDDALDTIRDFAGTKPVVVEETFPLKCGPAEFGRFLDRSAGTADGWIGFYWGATPAEYRGAGDPAAPLVTAAIERFTAGPPRRPPREAVRPR